MEQGMGKTITDGRRLMAHGLFGWFARRQAMGFWP